MAKSDAVEKTARLLSFPAVLQKEIDTINRRSWRKDRPVAPIASKTAQKNPVYDTVGLALSGGGIRSAAFCLGAVQALEEAKLVERIDYLSTVSGGGYVGASLTARLSSRKGEFPFLSQNDFHDTDALRHIRDYSNYLVPRGKLDLLINLAIYLRGLAANAIFVVPVLLFLAFITLAFNPDRRALQTSVIFDWQIEEVYFSNAFGVSFFVLLVALCYFFAWAVIRTSISSGGKEVGTPLVRVGFVALIVLMIAIFCELQPYVVDMMFNHMKVTSSGIVVGSTLADWLTWASTIIAPVMAFISLFGKTLGESMKSAESESGYIAGLKKWTNKLAIYIAAAALPFLIWVAYLFLCYWGVRTPIQFQSPDWLMWVASQWFFSDRMSAIGKFYLPLAILFLLPCVFMMLKPNANSLHRLYQDRLSRAFLGYETPDKKFVTLDRKLSEIDPRYTPYHLINTALNIQGSRFANRRGRNADFFLFSKDHLGSEATGYVATTDVEATNRLTLATAMAISGAAISSNMGSESIRLMSPTLALLNLRLGYWMPSPRSVAKGRRATEIIYLLYEIFGWLHEKSAYVYLTDGGHIENLGIYELLRRRCRLIVAIDAEADPNLHFDSLIKLQRYARIDLGIRINLPWREMKSTKNDAQFKQMSHCAVGTIEYSQDVHGYLLYVKASMTGDENDYIQDYARRYKAFPHETTGDQFFSEEQFEVYRSLGFHSLHGFLSGKVPAASVPKQPKPPTRANIRGVLKEVQKLLGITPDRTRAKSPKLSGPRLRKLGLASAKKR